MVGALRLLERVIPTLEDEQILWLGENLPKKLFNILKHQPTTVKRFAVSCCGVFVVRLAQSGGGGPQKKLCASLVNEFVHLVLPLAENELTGVCCEALSLCIVYVPNTVGARLAQLRQTAISIFWKSSPHLLPGGARLLAQSSVLEKPNGWSKMLSEAFNDATVVASQASRNLPQLKEPIRSAILGQADAHEQSKRSLLMQYDRICTLIENLLTLEGNHAIILPLHIGMDHFFRILCTDASLSLSPELLSIKRRCLQCFSVYAGTARSGLLLHHASVIQMLQSSFAWAKSHQNATLAAVAQSYVAYVQHVPVGHLERSLFQTILSTKVPNLLEFLPVLVQCRPGLWAQTPIEIRLEIEQAAVVSMLVNPAEGVPRGAELLNASAVLQLPALPAALACSKGVPNAYLGPLALRLRPPAPMWPVREGVEAGEKPKAGSTNVFADFGTGGDKRRKTDELPVFVGSKKKAKKVAVVAEAVVEEEEEEEAGGVEAMEVDQNVEKGGEEEEEEEEEQPNYSAFQPQLAVHSQHGGGGGGSGQVYSDDDEEEDVGDMVFPVLVDASPSNSENSE
jgi:hypothetical protein